MKRILLLITLVGTVATMMAQLSGGAAEVSVEQLPVGVYVAVITDQQGHKATCKFIKR